MRRADRGARGGGGKHVERHARDQIESEPAAHISANRDDQTRVSAAPTQRCCAKALSSNGSCVLGADDGRFHEQHTVDL
jgi:hypothetical protein